MDDIQCCRMGNIDDGLTMLISEWQHAALEAELDQIVHNLGASLGVWLHGVIVVFNKEQRQILIDPTKIVARIHEIAGVAEIPKEFLIMSIVSGIGDSLSTTGTADDRRSGRRGGGRRRSRPRAGAERGTAERQRRQERSRPAEVSGYE